MSTSFKLCSLLAVFSLLLGGCSVSNQSVGQVTGAVAGGVAGSQFGGGSGQITATALGALAGGVIGGNIGSRLDNGSRKQALQAEYNALENGRAGQSVQWQGNQGSYGTVVPHQTYQVGSQNCRRYTHTIYIDGAPQQAAGTACRNANGTWTPLT